VRLRALHVGPTVAPIARVERVLDHLKARPLQGQRHGEKVLELRRIELVIDHLIQGFQKIAYDRHTSPDRSRKYSLPVIAVSNPRPRREIEVRATWSATLTLAQEAVSQFRSWFESLTTNGIGSL